jgi:ATP-binding cassette subfamily F protein 3
LVSRNGAGSKAGAADGSESNRSDPSKPRVSKKEQRRQAGQRREALTPLKRRLTQAEHAVDRLESEKAELIDALADPQLYLGNPRQLADMQKRLAQLQARLASAEEAWAGAQEAWDQAQAKLPESSSQART